MENKKGNLSPLLNKHYNLPMPFTLTAAADDNGRRLDRILRKALRDMPLSGIHKLLRKGAVLVDGKAVDAGYRIQTGQIITVKDAHNIAPDSLSIPSSVLKRHGAGSFRDKSSQIASDTILFEGAGLLILNKPAGITVHSNDGICMNNGKDAFDSISLDVMVRSYLEPKLPPSLSFRPGPLHRLDKMSSGIIVFSTNLEGARFFSAMMRQRIIKKTYLALVEGMVKKAENWQDELIRDQNTKKTYSRKADFSVKKETKTVFKSASTHIKPLQINKDCTLIQAEIETGRTHQIRSQAASHGHPLLGDRKYGGRRMEGGFLLHAWRMEIPGDTAAGFSPLLIKAPAPIRFENIICELFGVTLADLCTAESPDCPAVFDAL